MFSLKWQKSKNIQPGQEEQHSYYKKRVRLYLCSEA